MSMHPIRAAALDARLATLFAGLTVLQPVSSTGRVVRGMLHGMTTPHRWRTFAASIEGGPSASPAEAADKRTLATRLRALADGKPIAGAT